MKIFDLGLHNIWFCLRLCNSKKLVYCSFTGNHLACVCYTQLPRVHQINNSKFTDKPLSARKTKEQYISEVITNFIQFGNTNDERKPYHKAKSTLHLKKKKAISKLIDPTRTNNSSVSSSFDLQSIFSSELHVNNINEDNNVTVEKNLEDKYLGSNVNDEIKSLISQSNLNEAFHIFEISWEKKNALNYEILRSLVSIYSSAEVNVPKIKRLQEATKYFYPKLFEREMCFNHYLCEGNPGEATFLEGNYSESFILLRHLMESHPGARRLKEIGSFIMKRMTSVPENYVEEAFEISCNFIQHHKQGKPAFALFMCLIQSSIHRHHCLANSLIDFHPKLLDSRFQKINNLIEKAYLEDDADLLQRLTECFLKINNKKHITAASSALLSLHCLAENMNSANEVIKFAKQEQLILSENGLQLFMNLLHKMKMPTPLSILASKYGYGDSKLTRIKRNKAKPNQFKFNFD